MKNVEFVHFKKRTQNISKNDKSFFLLNFLLWLCSYEVDETISLAELCDEAKVLAIFE